MRGDPSRNDICSQAGYLSHILLYTTGLHRSVVEGRIRMEFIFHNSCPFNDPLSYADPESLPVHYMPLWDTGSVCDVLSNFAWAMPSLWTNFDLRAMVRFPHFAWFAPSTLGNLSAMRLSGDFVASLVRSTLRGSVERDFRNPFLTNVRALCLHEWIAVQQDPLFRNYSISPLGTIHDVNPKDSVWYSDLNQSCNRRLETCVQNISPHSAHFSHELDVLRMVLDRIHYIAFRILDRNGIVTQVAEAPDMTMTTARMKLYEQVFDACMHEIERSVAKRRDGTTAPEHHEEIRYMSAHLRRLTAAGMWDRKWRVLPEGRHYLVRDFTGTGGYLCTCGEQLSRRHNYLLR